MKKDSYPKKWIRMNMKNLIGLVIIFVMIGEIFYDVFTMRLVHSTPEYTRGQVNILKGEEQERKILTSGTVFPEKKKTTPSHEHQATETPKEIEKKELLTPKTEEELSQLLLNSTVIKIDDDSDNITFLLKVFEKMKDPTVLNNILQVYHDEYQFVSASKLIHQYENDPLFEELDPKLILDIEFNAFSLADEQAITKLLQMISKLKGRVNEETIWRYKGIITLMQKDYDNFFLIARGFENFSYKNFASKLQIVSDTIHEEKDMPEYYIDALFAVELFHQGLFQPAKVLALKVMSENSKYILPYQILAYSNFLTNSRSAAISYLEVLLDLDKDSTEKYFMLLGVAQYRNKDYEQSIYRFSQVTNSRYSLDKERYLALDYQALHQTQKLLSSREKILGYPNLRESDFYNYFYSVIFEPYQQGEKYELYNANKNLYEKYLTLCSQKYQKSDEHICKYGEIGRMMVEGKNATFEDALTSLVQEYPQGYLYHLLGDRYLRKGDNEKAQLFLSKAIGMVESEKERSTIKTTLRELLE